MSASDLYREYTKWADENGEHPLKKRLLSQRLSERGLLNVRGTGGYYYVHGIRLAHL